MATRRKPKQQPMQDPRGHSVRPNVTTSSTGSTAGSANNVGPVDDGSWSSQTTLPRIQESLQEAMIPERGSSSDYLTLSDRESEESSNMIRNLSSRVQSGTSEEEFITDTQMNSRHPPAPSTNNLTATQQNYEQRFFENNTLVHDTITTTLNNLFLEDNDTSTACNSVVGSSSTLEGNNVSAGPSGLLIDTDECPTRDTNVNKFERNLDVRYLDNLTSRIKGAIIPKKYTCEQGYCNKYRERWEQHNLMYHQGSSPVHLCHHQHPGCARAFHTAASETRRVARVSSAHATQTTQPSKRDRCIEFKVPKVSFANQVHHASNVMVKFTKSTSVADFGNCIDRANTATSIIKSILAESSDSCETQNNDANELEVMANRSEAVTRSSTLLTDSIKNASYPWDADDTNADVESVLSIEASVTTPKVTPRRKMYEEQLKLEIFKWLDDVPVFPDQKESAKDLRKHLGLTLIQSLLANSHRVKEPCYGDIVKNCVENCVSELPMWCPGNKNDEESFRQRLSENLFNRICLLNEKVFDTNHIDFDVRISEILKWPDESYVGSASTSKAVNPGKIEHFEGRSIEEIISLHVARWISDDVIRIYPNYSEHEFVTLLLESLKPFLHQGSKVTFAKLSKRIFEILDELPLTICSETDKALRLYRLSEDLADVIRQHGAIYCRDILWEDSSINHNSTLSLNEFKNIIKVEVRVCLEKFRLHCDEIIVNDITEVLAEDFDTVRTGTKSDEPLTALCKLLERTGLMKDELFAVAMNLRSCIRMLPVVYDMQTSQGNGFLMKSLPVSNTVVVFRNEQGRRTKPKNKPKPSTPNLSTTTNIETELTSKGMQLENVPQKSTPKQGRNEISFAPEVSSIQVDDSLPHTYKMPHLSPQATAYLNVVENEVEKWIDSLPAMRFNTPEDLKFKRTMIKDLAADILDRARWRQLHSDNTSDTDDLEHVRFIIFRWIWRISDVHEFERDDKFNNKLLQLVHALRKIPIPDLTTPYLGNRKDMKVSTGQRPTGVDILEDEISIFLDEHPPHLFVDRDKASRNKMINELAICVREHMVNEQNPEEKIEATIEEWIIKVVNPETNATDMKILLKERITSVPRTVFQPHIKSRSQMDTERAIDDGIFWLQKQRFYLQCTPSGQKEQERRTAAMVKSLLELSRLLPPGTVTQEERSNQILTEMVDHLKFFPTGSGQRMGEIYSPEQLRLVAIEVVKYLAKCDKVNKESRQDLSSQIANLVNNWLEQIPIKTTTTQAKEQFEVLKANLILSLLNLKMLEHEQPADIHENLLRSEIKKFLQDCPLDERVPSTEKGILQKAQELVDMLKVDQSGKVDDKSESYQMMDGSTSKLPCLCPTAEDQKLKEFLKENIQKFQTGDAVAKKAFADRLVREFENINLKPCEMEACKFSCTTHQNHSVDMRKFNQELVITKSITEWLKDLPLTDEFYSPANQERSKIISDLAEKIYNTIVSTESFNHSYLYNMILDWMAKLPLKNEFQKPVMLDAMTQALKSRIERDLAQYNADHPYHPDAQAQLPSSSVAYESVGSASKHDIRTDVQKLEDFVENFMTMNRNIDISDDVIREAYAYKLLQALKIAIKHLIAPVSDKYALYEALGEVPMPGDTSVVRYTRQMRLDREVKEWMDLLPKVPADKKEQKWRDNQCTKLAKYIADVHEAQITNPWHNYQNELVNIITETLDRVLEPGHKQNYMELTNGLLMRQLAVADEFYPKTQPQYLDSQDASDFDRSAALHKRYTPQEESLNYGGFSANVPQSSSRMDFHPLKDVKRQKPMDLLIKAIEDWSKEVPLEVDEERKKALREYIVQLILRKVGQLNMDPNIYNDNLLYRASLTEEIDELLSALPQNPTLQNNKERLKSKLVKNLSEVNVIQRNVNAGENYKKKLEDNIQSSLPKPMNQEEKAAIDLIKTAIAEEFILEKYQQGDGDLKSQYEDKVINDLRNVIDASVFSQSDMSGIHNSIKTELGAVTVPNKEAIILEVEEIKTKNVIIEWFDGLPLISPQNNQELLDRDRIQSLLAKRLHEIEKDESDQDFLMRVIIVKWLQKLRYHDGQERFIDDMAQNLVTKLKTTEVARQATLKIDDDITNHHTYSDIERQERMMTSTEPTTLGTGSLSAMAGAANKNCTEVIFERVQRWCHQLPLEVLTPEDEGRNIEFKNRMATKILFKIGELNRDDLIFNDEMLYSEELAEVLDKIITSLIQNENLKRNKANLIRNLVQEIIELRPCIKEEKDRHHYKQQLYNSVAQVMKHQPKNNISKEQKALLENFQEEVVDDFIEYNYHNDESGKKSFKEKILNETQNYLSTMGKTDPTTTEELFRELSKVPVPTDAAVGEEIQEIRLKQQISDWMQELPLPKPDPVEAQHRNKIKLVLAKRINEIEKQAANSNTHQKMQGEITKYMKKVTENIDSEILTENVKRLTEKLNRTAPERRTIRLRQRIPKLQSNQRSQASDSFFRPMASTSQAYLRPALPNLQRCNQTCPQSSHFTKTLPSQSSTPDVSAYIGSGPSSDYNQHALRRESQEGSTQTGLLMPDPGSFTQGALPYSGPFTQGAMPYSGPFTQGAMPYSGPFTQGAMPYSGPFTQGALPYSEPFTQEVMPCPGPFIQTDMAEAYSEENAIPCPSYSDMEPWATYESECQQDDGYVACPYFSNEEEDRMSKARNTEGLKPHMKGSKSSERCMRGRKTHCMCPDTDGLLTAVPCPIHERNVWRHPGCNTRHSRF